MSTSPSEQFEPQVNPGEGVEALTFQKDNGSEPASQAEFVQLFTRSQRRLYLYILSQVPHPVEAEEILQEANVIAWTKSSQYRSGSNFLPGSVRSLTSRFSSIAVGRSERSSDSAMSLLSRWPVKLLSRWMSWSLVGWL